MEISKFLNSLQVTRISQTLPIRMITTGYISNTLSAEKNLENTPQLPGINISLQVILKILHDWK